ncbi:MAG: hypothetical protein WAU32_09745, partial [Thermoanaerobaculia bacterium]
PVAGAARQLDRTTGGGRGRKPGQTVYTLASGAAEQGEPRPVEIRAGVTDGRFTQVASGELKVGETVVVGLATAKADASSRPPGMGGPGGGARRF